MSRLRDAAEHSAMHSHYNNKPASQDIYSTEGSTSLACRSGSSRIDT